MGRFVRVLIECLRYHCYRLLSSDARTYHKSVHHQSESDRRYRRHVSLPNHSPAGQQETADPGQLDGWSSLSSVVHQDASVGDADVFNIQSRLPYSRTLPCRRLPFLAQNMVFTAQGQWYLTLLNSLTQVRHCVQSKRRSNSRTAKRGLFPPLHHFYKFSTELHEFFHALLDSCRGPFTYILTTVCYFCSRA